jgi:SAM-dependent methyltransferase
VSDFVPIDKARPFDRVADRYDTSRGGPARGERIAADLHRWLGPGPVLEVGVGTGAVASALTAKGHVVFGVDLAHAMLRRAGSALAGRLVRGDALALPVADGAVGDVIMVAVLHVVTDIGRVVAEAARVLRPAGGGGDGGGPGGGDGGGPGGGGGPSGGGPGGRLIIVHGLPVRDHSDIEDCLRPLDRLRSNRGDTEFAITAATRAAGLRPVADTMTGRIHWSESPDQVADHIEARAWSYLWDVPEPTWTEQVVPAIDLLRDLPRPTHPRPRAERFALSVYRRT